MTPPPIYRSGIPENPSSMGPIWTRIEGQEWQDNGDEEGKEEAGWGRGQEGRAGGEGALAPLPTSSPLRSALTLVASPRMVPYLAAVSLSCWVMPDAAGPDEPTPASKEAARSDRFVFAQGEGP